ncbi:hypothetical protein ColTof4_13553 [Colletotrichum tofieldiae]|nr:hypothetical protein ColTof4_13553 [Colletotrichum tofieldiae]
MPRFFSVGLSIVSLADTSPFLPSAAMLFNIPIKTLVMMRRRSGTCRRSGHSTSHGRRVRHPKDAAAVWLAAFRINSAIVETKTPAVRTSVPWPGPLVSSLRTRFPFANTPAARAVFPPPRDMLIPNSHLGPPGKLGTTHPNLCVVVIVVVVIFVCYAEVWAEVWTQVPLDAANRTINIHLTYASIARAILLDDGPLYGDPGWFAYDSMGPLTTQSSNELVSPPGPSSLSLSSAGDFVPEKLFFWDVESVLRHLRSELTTIDLEGLLPIHPDPPAEQETLSPNFDDDPTPMDTEVPDSRHHRAASPITRPPAQRVDLHGRSRNRKRLDELFDRAADTFHALVRLYPNVHDLLLIAWADEAVFSCHRRLL